MDDDRLERLLLCDESTLRAVAAWVSLPKEAEEDEDYPCQWCDAPIWYSMDEWAKCAGLTMAVMRTIQARLSSMDIIDPDGNPWPPALALARNLAASKIKRHRSKP